MPSKRITLGLLADVHLKNWIRAGVPVAKSDGGGLTFTLSKSGTATWILRYRTPGRPRAEITIGNYPDIGLAEARKAASKMRAQIDEGRDPAAEKREARHKARTSKAVEWLTQDYQAKVLPHLADSTQRIYNRQMKRILSSWKSRPASDITHDDVIELLRKSKSQYKSQPEGWSEIESLYVFIRELFKHAAGQHVVKSNPAVGVSLDAVIGKRPEVRKRIMLTSPELSELLAARMNRINQLSMWIILATCVRVSEYTTALRENVHLSDEVVANLGAGLWRIPTSKTGPAIEIPLAPIVVSWFRELLSLSPNSIYVCPARTVSRLHRGGGDAPIRKETIRDAIQYWMTYHNPKVRPFSPHDLRSTAKSHLRALGVQRDVSEMCLNHKIPGVEGIYDQYNYWKERRDALAVWADYLASLQSKNSPPASAARNAMAALRSNA